MSFNKFRPVIIFFGLTLISVAVICANTVFFPSNELTLVEGVPKNTLPLYVFFGLSLGGMLLEIGFGGFKEFFKVITSPFRLNDGSTLLTENFKPEDQFFRTPNGQRMLKSIAYMFFVLGATTLLCGLPKVIASDVATDPKFGGKIFVLIFFGAMLPLFGYGGLKYLQNPPKITSQLHRLFQRGMLLMIGSMVYTGIIIFLGGDKFDPFWRVLFLYPIFPLYGYLSYLYGKMAFASGFSYSTYKNIMYIQKTNGTSVEPPDENNP